MRKIVQCSISVALAVILSACSTAMPAEPSAVYGPSAKTYAKWRPVDAGTGQIADLAGLRRLAADFPASGSVRLRLLNAAIDAGDLDLAFETVADLSRRGYRFSPATEDFLVGLYDGDRRERLILAFGAARPSLSASEVVDRIPADALLVESVWRDETGEIAVASTVVGRSLFVKRGEGAWEALPLEGAGSLTGMVSDPRRRILWIGSGVVDQTPDPESAFRGLIGIDPVTGQEVARVIAPPDVTLSDLAITSDGDVIAADPLGGGIYVGHAAGTDVETLLEPGTFRSPQGMAFTPEGTALYVSDYRYGLARIDLASGDIWRIEGDATLLDGIDGLWWWNGGLLAVQNGTSPMRIVHLALSEDGLRVTSARPLETAHPDWTEPLGGSLVGDALLYVGNGSWDLFAEGGALAAGAEPRVTQIRRIDLLETPPPRP